MRKLSWRVAMLASLALLAALAAVSTASARVEHARSTAHAATPQRTLATPTIVLGSKNFTEEYILGELYKQALEAKGFNVNYKKGVGSTELIHSALDSGKIDMYPEYTGTALNVVF